MDNPQQETIACPVCRCRRCNYRWLARGPNLPTICARCKSALWNKPRQRRRARKLTA